MMNELSSRYPGAIQLIAINEVGHEASTDDMAALGDIPLLQDAASVDAWGTWNAVYRDVVIVSGAGLRVEAYNLTTFDLSKPENYAVLKDKLEIAAGL